MNDVYFGFLRQSGGMTHVGEIDASFLTRFNRRTIYIYLLFSFT